MARGFAPSARAKRHTLLLAAGEGVGIAILKAVQTNRRELLFDH